MIEQKPFDPNEAKDFTLCVSCGEKATHQKRYKDFFSGEIEMLSYCDECDKPEGVQVNAAEDAEWEALASKWESEEYP